MTATESFQENITKVRNCRDIIILISLGVRNGVTLKIGYDAGHWVTHGIENWVSIEISRGAGHGHGHDDDHDQGNPLVRNFKVAAAAVPGNYLPLCDGYLYK